MPIRTACPSCKAPIRAHDSRMGQSVACPRCKRSFIVPASANTEEVAAALPSKLPSATDQVALPHPDDEQITVRCEVCDDSYAVDIDLAGRVVRCRTCQQPLTVPDVFRRRDRQEPPRPSRFNGKVLVIATCVAFLLIAAGVVAVWPTNKSSPVAVAATPVVMAPTPTPKVEVQAESATRERDAAEHARQELERERHRLEQAKVGLEREQQRARQAENARRAQEAARADEDLKQREKAKQDAAEELRKQAVRQREEKSKRAQATLKRYVDDVGKRPIRVPEDIQRITDVNLALDLLTRIHGAYVGGTLTKDKAAAFIKASGTRREEIWQEAAYLAKLGGDWKPEYADFAHDGTIGEAWTTFSKILTEMVERGEGGFDFQRPRR